MAWVDVAESIQVRLSDQWSPNVPLPPQGWCGEIRQGFVVDAVCPPDEDIRGVQEAAAYCWRRLGLGVGERPRVEPEPELLPDGRRRYTTTTFVSVPPDWQPPGQQAIPGIEVG